MASKSTRLFPALAALLVWVCATAAPATAAGPSLLPGDALEGPAIAAQTAPVIARGGDSFLAVWQDLRTSPFAGPPFATEGRGFDIYARRLDAAGSPIDPEPFVVASVFGDQTAPQVAWNGQFWLVAWAGPNSSQWDHKIQAVRIAPDGTLLDDPPITVINRRYRTDFVLTSSGTEWLVALQSSGTGEEDLRAVRIAGDGSVLNPGGTQLFEPPSLIDFRVASAYNDASGVNEYLLLWKNSSTAEGRRFAPDLAPIGEPFPVPGIEIASNDSEYLLAWVRDGNLVTSLLTTEGVLQDPGGVAIASAAGFTVPAEIRLAWDGLDWWVSWRETLTGIVYARVDAGGATVDFGGVPLDASIGGTMATHELADAPAGGVQFVWADSRGDGPFSPDIFTAAVAPDATPGPDLALSTSARAQLRLDLAAGETELLAVFVSESSGDRRIVAQRLDAAGIALDAEPIEIATVGPSLNGPRVGFDGTRYLVVWSENGEILGRRVTPGGVPLDSAPVFIMEGRSPDVAGRSGTFLVVGTQPTIGVHFVHPFSMRVDGASGYPLDLQPTLLGQYYARFPRVAAFPGRWLATWQRNFSHDDVQSELMAAFVEADGTTAGAFRYDFFVGGTPDVAASATRALSVWRSGSPASADTNLYGRLINVDGSFATPTFLIAAEEDKQLDPSVAWNDTEFVVAWADKRNAVTYFDERTEIFAARVQPDGTVVDPTGFAWSDTTAPELLPVAAALDGRTVIAGSSFRDDPAFQSYRAAVEVFGGGNRWPVALASATPDAGDVPLAVDFSAAGSSDPDGTIAGYSWAFGDGGTAASANPSHTYAAAGEYLAELTVTDYQGARTRNTVRVVVAPVNEAPVAVAAAGPLSGRAPLSVVFDAYDSFDPDDGIAMIVWDFGDGGSYYGGVAYHTYDTPGTYTAVLSVMDHRGALTYDTVEIVVGDPALPPLAVAAASPGSGYSPLTVAFDSGGSSDPDGAIVGYRWEFGDGATSTEPNPMHRYEVGGYYRARLTVTDDDGAGGSDSVAIEVLQGEITSVANADSDTQWGTIAVGSYLDTHVADGLAEEIVEEQTGGKPSKRQSRLSHSWRFDVPSGPHYRFYLAAHHTPNAESDDFAFEYSRDGTAFVPMVVVSATEPGGGLLSYAFPEDVSGTLYVRVTDTDRTPGSVGQDTLYVDEMFVVTSWQDGGDTTPPAAPDGLVASGEDGRVALAWVANAEPDLAGYLVYRAGVSGGPYAALTASPQAATSYIDGGVTNGTPYYYVVTAVDSSDNESVSSAEASATPRAADAGATTLHVAALAVDTLNAGKGVKHGRATVAIRDDLGDPVAGALVTGSFSGEFVESQTLTTDAAGVAVFVSTNGAKGSPSFTFCVDDVTDAALTYDPTADVPTCAAAGSGA